MLLVANSGITKWCKNLKNDWNPGTCILIWKYSAWAIQGIPTWQGLYGFQKFLCPCALYKSSLSLRRVKGRLIDFALCLQLSGTAMSSFDEKGVLNINLQYWLFRIKNLEKSKITNSVNLHLGLISYSTVLILLFVGSRRVENTGNAMRSFDEKGVLNINFQYWLFGIFFFGKIQNHKFGYL